MAPKKQQAAPPVDREETAQGTTSRRSTRGSARKSSPPPAAAAAPPTPKERRASTKRTKAAAAAAAGDDDEKDGESEHKTDKPVAAAAPEAPRVVENVRGFKFSKKRPAAEPPATDAAAPAAEAPTPSGRGRRRTTATAAAAPAATTAAAPAASSSASFVAPAPVAAAASSSSQTDSQNSTRSDGSKAPSKRRTSVSLRGQRLSLTGEPSVALHADVETNVLYKHISSELPPALRMRQLLTWCCGRRNDTHPATESPVVTDVFNSVLKDLQTQQLNISWYAPPGEPAVKRLKPNPRNLEQHNTLAELSVYTQRLQTEQEQWTKLESETRAAELAANSVPHEEHVPFPPANGMLPAFLTADDARALQQSVLLSPAGLSADRQVLERLPGSILPQTETVRDIVSAVQRMEATVGEFVANNMKMLHDLSIQSLPNANNPQQLIKTVQHTL